MATANDLFESAEYETDIENKNYSSWVDSYPAESVRIFGDLIRYSGGELAQSDVQYFINCGLNLNELRSEYPSDSKAKRAPLHAACEFRLDNLIAPLLKLGADVNLLDAEQLSPLDHLLAGHGALDSENYEHVEQCALLLESAQVKKEVTDFIRVECCSIYQEKSSYLKAFLAECTTRNSGKLIPSTYAFKKYCCDYPYCLLDRSFMLRHRFLLTAQPDEYLDFISEKTDMVNYLKNEQTNSQCTGCPECIFGSPYSELNENQKEYINKYTDFKCH